MNISVVYVGEYILLLKRVIVCYSGIHLSILAMIINDMLYNYIYNYIYIHATSCYIFSMFDSSIIQPDVSDAHVAHPLSGAPLGALCLPHPDQLLGFVDTNIYGILYSVLRNITRLSGADELQNAGESAGDCSHVGGAVGTPS